MSKPELLLHLLIAIAVILMACRAAGALMRRIGQPQVMGEMIAGVLLGPSVLGAISPGLQAAIFPAALLPSLFCVSQLGLALYMFGQGLEFDPGLISRKSATSVSLAGILAPLALGGVLGTLMAQAGGFYAPGTPAAQAALFMGAAMSITAFPVLARIVEERGLLGTRVGTLALAAGSINDAAAWCLFAVVISAFRGSPGGAFLTLAGSAAYLLVIFTIGRRWLTRLADETERSGDSKSKFGLVLTALMVCALFTDFVGLHLVFGSFLLGAVIPKGLLNERLRAGVGPLSVTLLVPLFFAYSGLNTKLALIDSWGLAGIALIVFLAASVAKALACGLAARSSGLPNSEAAGLGALMNARGLMELILLNIALEEGIITPTLFAIMALMAVLTTFAATPAFELTRRGLGEGLTMPYRRAD